MSAFKMEGGKQYQQNVGSRRQVFNGTAKKTGYGKAALTKKNLKMNKHGRIVSVKKSRASRKNKHLGTFLRKRGSKTFGPVFAKGGNKMKGGTEVVEHNGRKVLLNTEWNINEFKKDYNASGQEVYNYFVMRKKASEMLSCNKPLGMSDNYMHNISLTDDDNQSGTCDWTPIYRSIHTIPSIPTWNGTHWMMKLGDKIED
jgi:hypothetical protein